MILKLSPVPGVGFPCLASGKALGVGSGSVLPVRWPPWSLGPFFCL